MKIICLLMFLLPAWNVLCQEAKSDSAVEFSYRFLNLHLTPMDTMVFRNVIAYHYKPDPNEGKRTEDYKYIHNGDPLKGAQDVFNSGVTGADWLKNFDFGKFASVIFEVRGDDYNEKNGAFSWTGKLIFLKLFNRRQVGSPKHKRQLPDVYEDF